ncbi:MAG: hypothetical protein NC253_06845 [Ruminococcus sp.]|nr:hypothetical protein [Ruminococcus sp.]MCM1479979.1 hypothetical protein [Muribaculaceae bacterium]
MQNIKITLDNVSYNKKPVGKEVAKINKRMANQVTTLKDTNDLKNFLEKVAEKGYTFNPSTFSGGSMKEDNFEQMQLMVLDFDDTISFDDVKARAEELEMPILSAYDTFSSKNHNRFRVLFLNDVSIINKTAAKIYKKLLLEIFPEADTSDKSAAHMYYGGNSKLMYFDENVPTINLESTVRNMTYSTKVIRGDKHYKEAVRRFAENNHIRLNNKGLLDISVSEFATEHIGANLSPNGGNSPNPIICNNPNGENPPFAIYKIYLEEKGTRPYSVASTVSYNNREYRSDVLNEVEQKCQLFRDFKYGVRKLHHNELFGLGTNLFHIETGAAVFAKILSEYPDYYSNEKQKKWKHSLKYFKDMNYNPANCRSFCANCDKCNHGNNILSTVKMKSGTIEKLPGYNEVYCTIKEMQEDLALKLNKAVDSDNEKWHIIKAQTAAGKTEAYLRLMLESGKNFLIVVPTNKLKRDVEARADKMGIQVKATLSIDEIKDEMPSYIWETILELRRTGQHSLVYSYICEMLEEENIPCLKEYIKEINSLENYEGNLITTHRKFLCMRKSDLAKYDEVIIDEDIILSSIAPNQCEIKLSLLKDIAKKLKGSQEHQELVEKIQQILKASKKSEMFKLQGFNWDYDKNNEPIEGISELTDLPALCKAKYFMCLDGEDSNSSIIFLKPYKFHKRKYIMVSATVDKDICEYCFGKENVKFYECKQAAYTGQLNQYYQKSMSRRCIDEDKSILDKIHKWSGFDHMITFKKYGRGDMYFGNAIGCDTLKGEDIDVVGTPYQVDFLYKLLPFSLGLDIDESAELKPCIVNHNGYRFKFTTYEDEVLQKFNMWMIESELEQAVGRARLLRCDCTVNLFSNFPLKQAVMKEFDYNNI